MTVTRSRALPIALAVAFVALAIPLVVHLAGGGPAEATRAADIARFQLLSDADIRRQPPGSPGRALLEFWREVQYRNAPRALEYFDARARPSLDELARQLRVIKNNVRLQDRTLKIVDTAIAGDSANVRTLVEVETSPKDGSFVRDAAPQAFNMRRTPSGWRLADNLYLEGIVAEYENDAGGG